MCSIYSIWISYKLCTYYEKSSGLIRNFESDFKIIKTFSETQTSQSVLFIVRLFKHNFYHLSLKGCYLKINYLAVKTTRLQFKNQL